MANRKHFRHNNRENGQNKLNGQPKNRTANQIEIRPNFGNLAAKRPIWQSCLQAVQNPLFSWFPSPESFSVMQCFFKPFLGVKMTP